MTPAPRTRTTINAITLALSTVLAMGAMPAAAAEGPDPDGGYATLEAAVVGDLGMSVPEFVAAGAEAEAASRRLDVADDGTVGVLTDSGVRMSTTLDRADGEVSGFADLEELRQAYLAQVGPDGLTGVVYTLDGFELMVTEPDQAYDRGQSDPAAQLLSPAQWGAAHQVAVTESDGPADPAANLHGGASVSFGGGPCTHGFNGYYKGTQTGTSAGHCALSGGTRVAAGPSIGTVDWYQFGAPGSALETTGTDFATYPQSSNYTYPPSIKTGSSTLTVTGRATAVLNMPVCKYGRMTGWACGRVSKLGLQWIGDGSGDINRPKRWVDSLFANIKVVPGDSGGPWVSGRKAVGVTSSYDQHADGRPYATAALLTALDTYRPGVQVKVWLGRTDLPSAEFSWAARPAGRAGPTARPSPAP